MKKGILYLIMGLALINIAFAGSAYDLGITLTTGASGGWCSGLVVIPKAGNLTLDYVVFHTGSANFKYIIVKLNGTGTTLYNVSTGCDAGACGNISLTAAGINLTNNTAYRILGQTTSGTGYYGSGTHPVIGTNLNVVGATDDSSCNYGASPTYGRIFDGVGTSTITAGTPTVNLIDWISQSPNDLTIAGGFNGFNISYNYTNITGISNILLNYSIISGVTRCSDSINGSCYDYINTYNKEYNFSVTDGNNTFKLNEYDYFPVSYMDNFSILSTTSKNNLTLTGNNDILKLYIKGMVNNTPVNYLEIQANSTAPMPIFYCNSSYTTGQPELNANCIQFGTLNKTSFNHTHATTSKHNLLFFPINATSRALGTVGITDNAYFLLHSSLAGNLQIGYINNTISQDYVSYSSNGGNTYNNLNISVDFHIHQFNADEQFNYSGCQNKSGVINCTGLKNDSIGLLALPPSSPGITNPIYENQNITRYLNITYTAATASLNTSTITQYAIYLLNSNLTLNATLKANNSPNLSYNWDSYNLSLETGTYYIMILANDSRGLTSYSISNNINITRNSLLNITAYYNVTGGMIQIPNFTINISDKQDPTINEIYTTNSNITNISIIKGHNYTITADAAGYAISTFNYTSNSSRTFQENLSLILYTTNSVYANIYDENTGLPITANITVIIDGANFSQTNYTTAGYIYVDNLADGNYTFKFYGTNYSLKTYSVSVANRSTQTLNAYLSSNTLPVTFTITDDQTGLTLEGASVTMERVINSSYVIVESKYSDLTGRAQFQYVAGIKYRFTISLSGYSSKVFILDPVLFSTYSVYLSPTVTESQGWDYADVTVTFYPRIFYNNVTNNFTIQFSSPSGSLTNYAVNLSAPGGWKAGATGILANGETFNLLLNITGATLYEKVNLTYNYTTTAAGTKIFIYKFDIIGANLSSNNSIINIKDKNYGLGLFEKAFITTLVIIFLSGFAYMLAGMAGALSAGLLVMGIATFLGFLPIASIVISLFIGLILIIASSIGGNK